MIIHSVALRNIRSYEHGSIDFNEGITLLSGDIGAGKSTILQAIEFALFGTQRAGLSGESMLRHGSEEGEVTLDFSIDNEDYIITRALKRGKEGVRQTDGTLSVNNQRETLSSQELKAKILEIIGYPEQLLTKSKGLVFRHTVYTPQEEMKHIIFMPDEERLNTLRMLFGIERYRTIKENAQLLLRELRSTERQLLSEASGKNLLEAELASITEQAASAAVIAEKARQAAQEATASVHSIRKDVTEKRAAWDAVTKLETERATMLARSREIERSIHNAQGDIKHIDEFLAVAIESVEDITPIVEKTRVELTATEERLLNVTRELASHRGQRQLHEEQEQQITNMDTCPVCKQAVAISHKHEIHTQTESKLKGIDMNIELLAAEEIILRKKRLELQTQTTKLHEQQKRYAKYQAELLTRKDKEHERERKIKFISGMETERNTLLEKIKQLPEPNTHAHDAYITATKTLETTENIMYERLAALTKSRDEHTALSAKITIFAERLAKAAHAQTEAAAIQTKRQWLEDEFLELVNMIERHVLASIHSEFRELFQTWFGKLIEDSTIAVSLGEHFEPIVSQNGYDSSLEQLSGGEKTAVALSYRLSLYRVVSDFISTVKTKDLLILDEPTDGFSTEQLSRVRDILRELNCKQIILVSHETQMESGCDSVIRINKHLHRSAAA